MSTAQQLNRKAAGATDMISVDLSNNLDTGETLSSASVSADDLTLGPASVNASVITIGGNSVPVGQALQFTCAGGTAGNDYTITVTYSTSAGRADLELYLVLTVI